MLGQFWYHEAPSKDDVVLELRWVNEERRGKISAPCWVVSQDVGKDLYVSHDDEYLRLPLAVSYGILVASSAEINFTISGDHTVWPENWGNLLRGELREFRVPAPISR